MKINVKCFECNPNGCGHIFTAPKEYNDIYEEFGELNIPYSDAVVRTNDKYIVLYCPKCDREIYRVSI